MARDYVVYFRLNLKQDLLLLYSCVLYRINLDVTIFLKKISSSPDQSPTSPQTPTNLGLKELPITDQILTKAPRIPGWGFTLNGA